MEKWLKQCLQEHESCRTNPISVLPSRILDLRSNEPDVVLCEPKHKKAGYVCLSHCWGDVRDLTTTTANLEALKRGITFQGLPRTFQEAIIFTRKVGIQYLWIDSLYVLLICSNSTVSRLAYCHGGLLCFELFIIFKSSTLRVARIVLLEFTNF